MHPDFADFLPWFSYSPNVDQPRECEDPISAF